MPDTPSLDELFAKFRLLITELRVLQTTAQRLFGSADGATQLEQRLEAQQEPLHQALYEVCWAAAELEARTLRQLHAKAAMLLDRCDGDADDLESRLTLSVCRDVLSLTACTFAPPTVDTDPGAEGRLL
jgi:hypothetical protein